MSCKLGRTDAGRREEAADSNRLMAIGDTFEQIKARVLAAREEGDNFHDWPQLRWCLVSSRDRRQVEFVSRTKRVRAARAVQSPNTSGYFLVLRFWAGGLGRGTELYGSDRHSKPLIKKALDGKLRRQDVFDS